MTRALLTGWFSFADVVATVGDELAALTVTGWLDDLGVPYDVAWAPFLDRPVDWQQVDPTSYTHLVFVGGPLTDHPLLRELARRFADVQRWALNVSVIDQAACRLFHRVWERDSTHTVRADLAAGAPVQHAPLVAVAVAPQQDEYRESTAADRVTAAICRWLGERRHPWFEVEVDQYRDGYVRTPAQVESLIARADVVVTSRLHAMVRAIRLGVPPIVCDPIIGGAKVTRQAERLGWPAVLPAEQVSATALDAEFERCRSGALVPALAHARRTAQADISQVGELVAASLADDAALRTDDVVSSRAAEGR